MEKNQNNQRIDYLKCKKYLNNLGISDDKINKALDDLGMEKKDLCDEIAIRDSQGKPYQTPHEFTQRTTGYFEDYKGEYIKRFTENANHFFVPATYQGLKHGEIIFQILSNRYKWFDSFKTLKSYKESEVEKYFDSLNRIDTESLPDKLKHKTIFELEEMRKEKKKYFEKSAWDLYEMKSENYEIYLNTEHGTLYVPLKAIINKDFLLIVERMISYSLSYNDPENLSGFALNHRGRTKEEYKRDKQKDHENMIKPLVSKEAEKLKKIFINEKNNND